MENDFEHTWVDDPCDDISANLEGWIYSSH